MIVPLGVKSESFRDESAANAVGESGPALGVFGGAPGLSGSAVLIAKAGGPARDDARSGSTGSETGRGFGISVGVAGSGVSGRARRGSTGGFGMRPCDAAGDGKAGGEAGGAGGGAGDGEAGGAAELGDAEEDAPSSAPGGTDGRPTMRGVGGDDAGGRVTVGSSRVEPDASRTDTARMTADDRGVEPAAAEGAASARGGSESGAGVASAAGVPMLGASDGSVASGGNGGRMASGASDGSVASGGSDGTVASAGGGLPGAFAPRGVGDPEDAARVAASGAKPRAGVDGPARSGSRGGVGLDGGGRSGRGGSASIGSAGGFTSRAEPPPGAAEPPPGACGAGESSES